MKSGSSASIGSGSQTGSAAATASCQSTSRPSSIAQPVSQRLTTTTCSRPGRSGRMPSTFSFIGIGAPRRRVASAVTSALASETSMRSFSDDAEKPPKTTLCTAPIRAQASIAAAVSGIIGMKIPTTSPLPTPRPLSTLAKRWVWSSSQS